MDSAPVGHRWRRSLDLERRFSWKCHLIMIISIIITFTVFGEIIYIIIGETCFEKLVFLHSANAVHHHQDHWTWHEDQHHHEHHQDKTCGGDAKMPSYGDRPIWRVSSELASLSCHCCWHCVCVCVCQSYSIILVIISKSFNFVCVLSYVKQVTNCSIPKVSLMLRGRHHRDSS